MEKGNIRIGVGNMGKGWGRTTWESGGGEQYREGEYRGRGGNMEMRRGEHGKGGYGG